MCRVERPSSLDLPQQDATSATHYESGHLTRTSSMKCPGFQTARVQWWPPTRLEAGDGTGVGDHTCRSRFQQVKDTEFALPLLGQTAHTLPSSFRLQALII